jgi:hypothetical protein
MKKAFKILGKVIIVFIAILIILPILFRGKIDSVIKNEANEMLNAKLDYSKLSLGFIKNFPNLSIGLKDLSIEGINEFKGDTLISANNISLVLNLFSFFKEGGIEVKKVSVYKPNIYAHILSNGKVNWDIMKEDSTSVEDDSASEESSFKLQIDKFKISDARIKYLDENGKMEFRTYPFNTDLRGKLYGDITSLDIVATAENSYYKLDNTAYLNGQTINLSGLIEADLANSKYSFTNTKLALNAINMGLNGNVLLADNYIDCDILADCKNVNFKDVLSLIPAVYTNNFENLNVGGDLSMDAWVKGRMKGDTIPSFSVKMNLAEGQLKYAQLPQSITDIFINLFIENPGTTIDATKIDLSKLSMLMAGNKLDAKLKLSTPISNPDFDAVMKGVIDFSKIKEVYPLPDTINLSGKVIADFAIKGNMDQIEREQYEQMSANGNINVKDFEATIGNMPKVFINNADANITPKELLVSDVDVVIGDSDMRLSGNVQNYIGYILKSTELKGSLNMTSNKLNMNEIFSINSSVNSTTADDNNNQNDTTIRDNNNASASESESVSVSDTSAILVPKNLNFVINAFLKEVLINKVILQGLEGRITIKDGEAILDNLKMDAFDGKLDVSGSYSSKDELKPTANLNLSFKNASFKTTFKQLDVIKRLAPLFDKIGGTYSMQMNFSSLFNNNLEPIIPTLNATGKLTTSSDVSVQNVKTLSLLSSLLHDENLKNWQMKEAVVVKFTVKEGKVNTSPFDVKLGKTKLNLSGITSLDSKIDYIAKVTLPDNKYINAANVKIGGTFSNPKLSLDGKNIAENLIKNTIGDKLPAGLDTLSVDESVQKKINEIMLSANAAGDTLIAKAERQKLALMDKAKDKLGKLAAETAGNKLIESAKKEKQKLLNKAELEIQKLKSKEQLKN